MNTTDFKEKISKLRTEKQSMLNDTFLWVKIAREAVEQLPDTNFEFEVPKTKNAKKMRTVSRNDGIRIKERILTKDIYNSAFVSMVATLEDYMSKIMTWILLYDNRRLKCTISGVSFTKDISIIDLIDKEKEELITNIINQRIDSLFYASPSKQLEYFDVALGLKIDEDLWGKWIEIKARRDLWIHNGGIVNQIYINKTGNYGLCSLDSEAIISDDYFNGCTSLLKSMIGNIDKKVRKTYITSSLASET